MLFYKVQNLSRREVLGCKGQPDKENFGNIFRILGRNFGPNLGFLYTFYLEIITSPSAQSRAISVS